MFEVDRCAEVEMPEIDSEVVLTYDVLEGGIRRMYHIRVIEYIGSNNEMMYKLCGTCVNGHPLMKLIENVHRYVQIYGSPITEDDYTSMRVV